MQSADCFDDIKVGKGQNNQILASYSIISAHYLDENSWRVIFIVIVIWYHIPTVNSQIESMTMTLLKICNLSIEW